MFYVMLYYVYVLLFVIEKLILIGYYIPRQAQLFFNDF